MFSVYFFRISILQFFERGFATMSGSVLQNAMTCTRLYTVQGSADKRNDIVYCGNRLIRPQSNVIFFGGDVQVILNA